LYDIIKFFLFIFYSLEWAKFLTLEHYY